MRSRSASRRATTASPNASMPSRSTRIPGGTRHRSRSPAPRARRRRAIRAARALAGYRARAGSRPRRRPVRRVGCSRNEPPQRRASARAARAAAGVSVSRLLTSAARSPWATARTREPLSPWTVSGGDVGRRDGPVDVHGAAPRAGHERGVRLRSPFGGVLGPPRQQAPRTPCKGDEDVAFARCASGAVEGGSSLA